MSRALCKAELADCASMLVLGAAFFLGMVGVDMGVDGLLPTSLPENEIV